MKKLLLFFIIISSAPAQPEILMNNDEIEIIKTTMNMIKQNLITLDENCKIEEANIEEYKIVIKNLVQKIIQKFEIATIKFEDVEEFFNDIYQIFENLYNDAEFMTKNVPPYCSQAISGEMSLKRFAKAFQLERQFLLETNFIAKSNDGIEKLFEKHGSTLYERLTVKIIDIVTLNSLLKTERKQYYNELLFNQNEDEVSPRRFNRSPPECGAVMEKAKQFACCWMPEKSDNNACFVNKKIDNSYKKCRLTCGCIGLAPWWIAVAIGSIPIVIIGESVNVVRRCFTSPAAKKTTTKKEGGSAKKATAKKEGGSAKKTKSANGGSGKAKKT